MSAGDHGGRPSVPHALRRPVTSGQKVVETKVSPDEAETVREPQALEAAAVAEVIALFRDPAGVTVETFLKALQITQRRTTVEVRQQDKLGVDLGVGKIEEKLGSIHSRIDELQTSGAQRRRIREWAVTIALVVAVASSAGQAMWSWLAPKAREDAHAVIVAPAVAAEAKVLTMEERVAEAERKHAETDKTLSDLRTSIERLNGAVVALASKLEEPKK